MDKSKTKNRGGYKLLLSFTKGLRGFFLLAVLMTVLGIIFNYLTPQVIKVTVDSVIGDDAFDLPKFLTEIIEKIGGRDALRANLYICAIAAALFSILNGVCTFGSRMSMARITEGTIRRLRNKLFGHIQRLPFTWHMQNKTGDIIQRCTSDVEVSKEFLSNQLLEVVRTVFLLIISSILMFTMNVRLTFIAIAFFPAIAFFSGFFFKRISHRFLEADEAEGALSAMVQENLTGVRVIRAFGRQSYEIDRFKEKNNRFADLWMNMGYTLGMYWGLGDMAAGIQILTVLVASVVFAVNGEITLGQMLVFIYYNSMLVWPVRSFGRILSEMSKTGVSLGRIKEILDAEEEKDNPDDTEAVDMHGDIEFENVTFDYYGAKPVIRNVSFKIKAGTTFGILGGTGSGKTTLMHLLDRLYDLPEDCGTIKIGGTDIQKVKREYLRKNIGIVLQEPFLYSRTLQDNIDAFGMRGNIDAIRRVAGIAAVDDSIMSFSQGYATMVGERGVTLSGGQKQRVAIARMLMQEAPVMVFDDSLSAVDTDTDNKIRASLRQNTKDGTVILISHRITTLMHADNILVMDNGSVSDIGTHDELIARDGIYKRIFSMQNSLRSETGEQSASEESTCAGIHESAQDNAKDGEA